jgi:hypothetical protein
MKNIISVLTSDIVKSSKLSPATVRNLMEVAIPDFISRLGYTESYSSYRGDECQFIVTRTEKSLYVSTLLRIFVITCTPVEQQYRSLYDIRTAIGIGTYEKDTDWSAFIYSGHLLDNMKGRQRTSVRTLWEEDDTDEELGLLSSMTDAIISKWSRRQAEIMLAWLTTDARERRKNSILASEFHVTPAEISDTVIDSDGKLLMRILTRAEHLISKKVV